MNNTLDEVSAVLHVWLDLKEKMDRAYSFLPAPLSLVLKESMDKGDALMWNMMKEDCDAKFK